MISVLIVEDEPYVAESLVALFRDAGMDARACATAEEALDELQFDVALVDLRLPGLSGQELLERLIERDGSRPVLMLTGHGTIPDAVKAMRTGALDFLTKPVEPDVIVERVKKAAERGRLQRERDALRTPHGVVAESAGMKAVLDLVAQVADGNDPVLLLGESGTGKEVVATCIHDRGRRRAEPMVRVNCAAVPESLFEVEFFGHEAGAYSGAIGARPGHFVEADGGTLFLDEVGILSAGAQAKLLRVLETGEVRPVGGTATRQVDVRIVAATNEALKARVDDGTFRADLYYRLAVLPIEIPPLRERPEDLHALAASFAAPATLTDAAKTRLAQHGWPGNVRELRNVIAMARLLAPGESIDAPDIEPLLAEAAGDSLKLKERVTEFERGLFEEALRRTNGKKADAARLLGIDPSNWSYHAKRVGL